MTNTSVFGMMISRLKIWWFGRYSPRERRALALAGVVVLTALLYQGYEFMARDGKRLALELPRKKYALAVMQRDAAEIERLRGSPGTDRATGGQILEAVRSAAEARGLKLALLAEGEAIRVEGEGEHAQILAWLAEIAEHDGLYPTSFTLRRDAGGANGRLAIVGRLENAVR